MTPIAIIGSPPFRARMREIRQFLVEIEAVQVYDQLLDDMEHIIYPNLTSISLDRQALFDAREID